jgi:hypothetical protein
MKNFIILILLLAVGLLVYLHFFKNQNPISPVIEKNTRTIELGKDSLQISFFYETDSITNRTPKQVLAYSYSIGTDTSDCADPKNEDCYGRLVGDTKPHNPPPPIIPDDLQKVIKFLNAKSITISKAKNKSIIR